MLKYVIAPAFFILSSHTALAQTMPDFSKARDQVIASCKLMPSYDYAAKGCQSESECDTIKELENVEPQNCDDIVDSVISDLVLDPIVNPNVTPENAQSFESKGAVSDLIAFMLINELISQDFEDSDNVDDFDFSPKRHLRPTAPTISDIDGPPPVSSLTPPGAPRLKPSNVQIFADDRDARPLVRYPGQMPENADRSGRCVMQFNVDREGKPFDIRAVSCTHKMFKEESVRAVSQFKFRPKVIDGELVERVGVLDEIIFRLTDGKGNILPE